MFEAEIFGKNVEYFDCKNCGYLQTEYPTWLERAYSSPINFSDTGIMARNLMCEKVVLGTLSCLGLLDGRVVDLAGGYGILTRLLRDRGVNAGWSDRYCDNLLARGFEHDGGPVDLATAFEAFEHFVDPLGELEGIFSLSKNLLISTELLPEPRPAPSEWWYYGLEHGQHIGFARRGSLELIAKRFDKHLLSDGQSFHLFTDRPVSARRWRLSMQLARRVPRFVSRQLTPLTQADFEAMAGTA